MLSGARFWDGWVAPPPCRKCVKVFETGWLGLDLLVREGVGLRLDGVWWAWVCQVRGGRATRISTVRKGRSA